jgi:competence protein ComFC
MGVVKIHPQSITGLWQAGYALDLHTTSSTPVGENQSGHMQFETERPAIAPSRSFFTD